MASSNVDSLLKDVTIKGVTPVRNKELGRGAYGRVFTVKFRGNVCAAKEIHPALIDRASPVEKKAIIDNFIRECHQCSIICHPNIVQFLGVYYSGSKKSNLPIMVMELMNASLTSYVKSNRPSILINTKLSILFDVSLGLSYLHTRRPVVIHRDLSPNNVMLTSQLVAKIGDLGVAKVIKADSRQTRSRLTTAPGTEHFMPPETLEANPVYGTAVDVFSFAGVTLHVFTEEWPKPCGQKRRDPVTRKLVAVTEVERRQEYLDRIPEDVIMLKELVVRCLNDDPNKRPPIQEISELISTIKQVAGQGGSYVPAKPKITAKADSCTSPGLPSTAVSEEQEIPQKLKVNKDFSGLKDHYHTILHLMPNTYELTAGKLQDYISDDRICSILDSSNSTIANKKILDCLIERMSYRRDLLDLCNQLESITTSHDLKGVINEIRSGFYDQRSNQTPISTAVSLSTQSVSSSDQQHSSVSLSFPSTAVSEEQEMPQSLKANKDFAGLKDHYHTILHLMPDAYALTVGKLQDYISDDRICSILDSSNSTIANKKILDCLIERMSYRRDLLDLCNQLESITTSHDLKRVINEIRSGFYDQRSNQTPISTAVSLSTQSVSSSDQQHSSVSLSSPSTSESKEQEIPKKLIDNKEFAELKTHYHTVLHLMPDDYESSIGKLQNYFEDEQIYAVLSSSNSAIANKIILDVLIERMSCREVLLDLCDQLESITTSHDLKIVIGEIRLGVRKSIQSQGTQVSTPVTTTTQTISSGVEQNTGCQVSTPVATSTQQVSSGDQPYDTMSPNALKSSLKENVTYKERRLEKGLKYLQPRPLPPHHVNRQQLLDNIVGNLLQANIDPNKYGTTLAITGGGGFGKTSIVISLCHHQLVKKHFTDGFVFIELGPQATNPSVKLKGIYKLLANEDCDINVVEHKIKKFTSDYYHNLLVIIDDVWHIEDAEPLLKAFSNCKTIITTRMNNISQYIPSKSSISIGPLTQNEAVSLLTAGVIDSSQLSQEDVSLLYKLAHGVHLWPLPLSLIRGLLSHTLRQPRSSFRQAIQNVQAELRHRGITAFDRTSTENSSINRKLAANACIEITLKSLPKQLSDKYKSLILWTGIGASIQTAVLNNLWNISAQEAENTVDALWGYGLVQFTDIRTSPNISTQKCVEVHGVISQYVIEHMDSKEVILLSPLCRLNTAESVKVGLKRTFQWLCGIHDLSLLSPVDYLKFILSETEYVLLPFNVKLINNHVITDPHAITLMFQEIEDAFLSSPYTVNMLSIFSEEIEPIIADCKQLLKNAYIVCREFTQSVQKNFHEKDYDKLIQTVEEFIQNYPLCNVAQNAVTVVKKIMVYCDGELLQSMVLKHERLQITTLGYHDITTLILPIIKLFIKNHKQITNSLCYGSPYIEQTYFYIISNKCNEEFELVDFNYLIKIQEVAPNLAALQSGNDDLIPVVSPPLLPANSNISTGNANTSMVRRSIPDSAVSNTKPFDIYEGHDLVGNSFSIVNTQIELNKSLNFQSDDYISNAEPDLTEHLYKQQTRTTVNTTNTVLDQSTAASDV